MKSNLDGRYHVLGKLQAAPGTVFERILEDAAAAIDAGAACTTRILVSPFPRYITGKCCTVLLFEFDVDSTVLAAPLS